MDTGSSYTMADRSYHGQNKTENDLKLTDIKTATGETVSLSGPHDLEIGGKIAKVYKSIGVNNGIPIIGTDLLKNRKAVIDYVRDEIRMDGLIYPMRYPEANIGALATLDGISEAVLKYQHLFETPAKLPPMQVGVEMEIDTVGQPIAQRAYRAPLAKRHIITKEIDDMLEKGIISPSSSPWSSPVLLVPKRDTGESRFVVDLRKVNSVTIKDRYPLPRIEDIFDALGGSTIYTTLDLKSGYWQLPIRKRDRLKTAFVCHMGQYEYNRVPFGLANAPAVFQRTMNQVLAPVIGKCAFVYIDDIIVYSANPQDHAKHLADVFKLLNQHQITLKRSKCNFGQSEVQILGFLVNKDGISPIPSKTSAISNLDTPRNVKDIRSFLGMVNYYRRVIPNYSQYSSELTRLTKKGVPFDWTPACERGFQGLKNALTSAEIMAYPQIGKPFKLYTDACDYAVGAILVQDDENNVERPIHYISHQLTDVQCKYATIEKEAYAIIYALTKLRPYLYGAEFTIYTDHKPLRSLFTSEMVNTKIQRWAIMIAEYGPTIEYRQGKHNVRADMLSRITSRTAQVASLDQTDMEGNEFREAQRLEFGPEWEDALTGESLDYSITNGLLVSDSLPHPGAEYADRLMLPQSYREAEMEKAHVAIGHMAANKTMRRLAEKHVWPGMRVDVRHFVAGCPTCKIHQRTIVRAPAGDMPQPHAPQEILGLDFIGPYKPPTSTGQQYVLVIVDHFSGWVEAYATTGQSALEIISVFTDNYLTRYSTPRLIINDNGHGFGSHAWSTYCQQSGIKLVRTTPVHPQANGKVERANRTLKEILAKFIGNKPGDWYQKLPMALAAMRRAVSNTTGCTPHYLTYGQNPQLPLDRFLPAREGELFGNRLDDLRMAYKEAYDRTRQMRDGNKVIINRGANVNSSLHVGDQVLLRAEGRLTNTARWDPGYHVTRVEGTTHWLVNNLTGVQKKVHREKVRKVDADMAWTGVPRRPRRQRKNKSTPNINTESEKPLEINEVSRDKCIRTRHSEPKEIHDVSSKCIRTRHSERLVGKHVDYTE